MGEEGAKGRGSDGVREGGRQPEPVAPGGQGEGLGCYPGRGASHEGHELTQDLTGEWTVGGKGGKQESR